MTKINSKPTSLKDITEAIELIESEYRRKQVDLFDSPKDFQYWCDEYEEMFGEEPTPNEVYEYKLECILALRDWEDTQQSLRDEVERNAR